MEIRESSRWRVSDNPQGKRPPRPPALRRTIRTPVDKIGPACHDVQPAVLVDVGKSIQHSQKVVCDLLGALVRGDLTRFRKVVMQPRRLYGTDSLTLLGSVEVRP